MPVALVMQQTFFLLNRLLLNVNMARPVIMKLRAATWWLGAAHRFKAVTVDARKFFPNINRLALCNFLFSTYSSLGKLLYQ
jgi:hypothetical protein